MAGFIEGIDRGQSTLFPERLEDWIGEDHLVRVVNLFVAAPGLVRAGVRAHVAGADGAARLSPGGAAQALRPDPPRKSKRVVAHSDHEREKGDQVSAYVPSGPTSARSDPDMASRADFEAE